MGMRATNLAAIGLAAVALVCGFASSDANAAKRCSSASPWYGHFSGDQRDPFFDNVYNPVSAQDCFKTEKECRRFINRQSGRLNGGPIRVMSCRRVG